MMIHAGFILPFLLLATAKNNVREQRTPCEVDGVCYEDHISLEGSTSNLSNLDSSPDFWDKVIRCFCIPSAMSELSLTVPIGIFVLLYTVLAVVGCFALSNWSVKGAGAIIGFVGGGVALVIFTLYAAASVVYNRRK